MKMGAIVDISGSICAVLTNSNTQMFPWFLFLLSSICTHHKLLELKICKDEFFICSTASYDILH